MDTVRLGAKRIESLSRKGHTSIRRAYGHFPSDPLGDGDSETVAYEQEIVQGVWYGNLDEEWDVQTGRKQRVSVS